MISDLGPSAWHRTDTELLFEEGGCTIYQRAGQKQLVQSGCWTDEHTKLAKRYQVTFVSIFEASFGDRTTAEFLLKLPPLRQLHVALNKSKDLSAIARLTSLEYLGILGNVVSPKVKSTPAVDFLPLRKLKKAAIQLCPPTKSILAVGTLKALEIWSDFDPPLDLIVKRDGVARFRDWKSRQMMDVNLTELKHLESLRLKVCLQVRNLDLTCQADLKELHLDAVPNLRSIGLHPKARVRNMKLNRCGAYRIDWQRIGPDLEKLELVGPLKFPLEDITQAPNLQVLRTNGIRKFPSLRFLSDLRHLRLFDRQSTPGGLKLSKEDQEIIRTINTRETNSNALR